MVPSMLETMLRYTACRSQLFRHVTCKQHRMLHLTSKVQYLYDPNDPRLKFVKVDSHEAMFNVGYLDEGPTGGATVLAVHGNPGGATDYDILMEKLVEKGLRVVVPSMPGNPVTKKPATGHYDYSTKHRAEFLCSFLDAINLRSIDVTLGHSIGGPPVLELAAKTSRTKAVGLINSVGHLIHRGAKPYWGLQMYSAGLGVPILGSILRKTVLYNYRKRGFNVDDVDHLVNSLAVAAKISFHQVKKNAEAVQKKGLPVLSAFCQNDQLIEWQISLSTAHLAGVPENAVSYFDTDKSLLRGPKVGEVIPQRALVFANGGHFAIKSNSEDLSKCIIDMINHAKH